MMNSIDVPFLENSEIVKEADDFLQRFHPNGTLPIPIDSIIEFKFTLALFPMKNLKRDFGIDSALARTLGSIYIDEEIASPKINHNRFRFSLAHEIGHLRLHRDIYAILPYSSNEAYMDFIDKIDPKIYSRMEYQAYTFAGLILVPPKALEKHFKAACKKLKAEGFDASEDKLVFYEFLFEHLTHCFEVSDMVIQKRIKFDSLII